MSRALPRFRRNNPTLPAAPANSWQLALIGTIEQQMTVNTFYYRDGASALDPAFANETALMAGWRTAVGAAFYACCSSDWYALSIVCRSLNVPTRAAFTYTYTAGGVGSAAAGHLPTTVAGIISRRTGTRGQCGRGRVYMPGVPQSFITTPNFSTINGAGQTAYQALATAMMAGFTNGGYTFTPGLGSHGTRTQQPRVVGYADLTATVVRPLLGNVRRRRLGRGK